MPELPPPPSVYGRVDDGNLCPYLLIIRWIYMTTLIMMTVKKKMNDNDDEDMTRVTSASNILHDGPQKQKQAQKTHRKQNMSMEKKMMTLMMRTTMTMKEKQ